MYQTELHGSLVAEAEWHGVQQSILCHGNIFYITVIRACLKYTYDAMKGYVRYMLTWTDKDGIMYSQREGNNGKPLRWFNLGDWCAPAELPPDMMVHTFYLWRCADFTSKTAKVLGFADEANEYSALAERTKQAFLKKFFDQEKGTYGRGGGNIFALLMGVPADQEQRVIDALKKDIAAEDGHLDTGIFGTQFFFEVLADYGMQELAYEAMNKKNTALIRLVD